jgi:hypothetical protein
MKNIALMLAVLAIVLLPVQPVRALEVPWTARSYSGNPSR